MDKDNNKLSGLLQESLEKVGRERDEKIMDAIGSMSREEFKAMIARISENSEGFKNSELSDAKQGNAIVLFLKRNVTYLRLAAACIVVALVIYGINDWKIAQPDTNVQAHLFAQYYKVDNQLMQQYKNAGAKENAWGGKSTAAILEIASGNIVSDSKERVRVGVLRLENLIQNPLCREDLKHEIHWYLGLGYLKQDKKQKAKAEFREVIRLGSYHKKDAEDIIRKLK